MKLTDLFKHTAIYGIATILPRLLNLVLTPLHIDNLHKTQYGEYQSIFAYLILGNVLLSYGMETAFFRFSNKGNHTEKVQSTALMSLVFSSLGFLLLGLIFSGNIAYFLDYKKEFVQFSVYILALDALAVIPFAWLRNQGKSLQYAIIKIGNVGVNLLLNYYFLVLLLPEKSAPSDPVFFIFLANLIASGATLLVLLPIYFRIKFYFSFEIWKEMLQYAFPVLVAGVAFAVNEAFDKIFLRELLPSDKASAAVGIYAACYKMGVFMTLFVTAYKLGVEPFFFSAANDKNAPKTYATMMRIFVLVVSFILLFVSVYADIFKRLLIPDASYWEALWIVPLVLLANLCLGVYHNLSVWYKVTDNTRYGAYISVLGGVVTIVANLALIPPMGYRGAALATLLAYGVMMLVSYFIGQRKYFIPYEIPKIMLYLGGSIVASFLNFYLLERNLISGTFFILLFLVMAFYLEKKNIKWKRF